MQPGRQSGGFAQRPPVPARGRGPHHDEAGGDADAGAQRHPAGRGEGGDRLDQIEPGAHGALGVVLVRAGVPEVDQHAVAEELEQAPVVAGDDAGAHLLVAPDHRLEILRVEAPGEGGRVHEVAEQHGEVPPLGRRGEPPRRRLQSAQSDAWGEAWSDGRGSAREDGRAVRRDAGAGVRPRRWCGLDSGPGQGGDRAQQRLAVAERQHPEFAQVVGGQRGQQFRADVVLAEGPRVVLQPQATQPIRDVHGSLPARRPPRYGAGVPSGFTRL